MPAYQFQFSPRSEQEFSHLARSLQLRIIHKLEFWEKTDEPLSFAKKLQGEEHFYRFRMGDYRLIVTPKNTTKTLVILLILKLGHRREIYTRM